MIGPLHLLVIDFDEVSRARDITRIVNDLKRTKAIHLFDLLCIIKQDDGQIEAKQISEFETDEKREYGALIKRLIGLVTQDEERVAAGELVDSLRVAEDEFGLSESEVLAIADRMPAGSSGILAIFEHTWARSVREDIQKAGGHVRAQGLIDPNTLGFAADELTTTLDAISRAESSAMDHLAEAQIGAEPAAQERHEAREIEAKAVLRAMNALVKAQVIEKKAAGCALDTIIAADVLEAAAVKEAVRSLTSW
jgi:uncharacterized membrane protein